MTRTGPWLLTLTLLAGCTLAAPAPTSPGPAKASPRASGTRAAMPEASVPAETSLPPVALSAAPRDLEPSTDDLPPHRLRLPARITIDVPLSLGGSSVLSNNGGSVVANNGSTFAMRFGAAAAAGSFRLLDEGDNGEEGDEAPTEVAPLVGRYLRDAGSVTALVQAVLDTLKGRGFDDGEVFDIAKTNANAAEVGRVDQLGEQIQLRVWDPEVSRDEPIYVLRSAPDGRSTLQLHWQTASAEVGAVLTAAMTFDPTIGSLAGDVILGVIGPLRQDTLVHIDLTSTPDSDATPARFVMRANGLDRNGLVDGLQRSATVVRLDATGAGAAIYAESTPDADTGADGDLEWLLDDRTTYTADPAQPHHLYLDAAGKDVAPADAPAGVMALAPSDDALVAPPSSAAVLDHPRDDARFIYPADARGAVPQVPARTP